MRQYKPLISSSFLRCLWLIDTFVWRFSSTNAAKLSSLDSILILQNIRFLKRCVYACEYSKWQCGVTSVWPLFVDYWTWKPNLGNCDIRAERKILFFIEMKLYKIDPRPKGWVKQNILNFTTQSIKRSYKSCLKFHQFFLDESEQNEDKGYIMEQHIFM